MDQHFLIDKRVINRIIEYADLNKKDVVLEIGAGTGNLTQKLAEFANKVIAIEIDNKLIYRLNKNLKIIHDVEIIHGDALKIEFPEFNKVVSNLPYSISSKITFKLLQYNFDFGILMYQHDFARRMIASYGNKDYSRLSVNTQYFAEVEILEIVPKTAFHPRPKVESAIIKLTPRESKYMVLDEQFFLKFVTAMFTQRRKKIKNAIINTKDMLGIKDLDEKIIQIPSYLINKRPEELSPVELAYLSNFLAKR
ncbi:MAG: 16S rRNA (adenine(1518)-N(6)/adenine(1519)-N(6))-dimethyltransferase RsmA [Methanosarcinales archaeon]